MGWQRVIIKIFYALSAVACMAFFVLGLMYELWLLIIFAPAILAFVWFELMEAE